MMRVLAYGTFDLFHIGHLNFLRRAKELGDYLIVGVAADEFNRQKGKISIFSYEERSQIVASIRYVDEIFPANGWEEKLDDIQKYKPDILVASQEWKDKYDTLSQHCKVVCLPRTNLMSSSRIKEILKKIERLDNLLGTFNRDELETIIKYIFAEPNANLNNINRNGDIDRG